MFRKYAKKALKKLSSNDYRTLNVAEINSSALLSNVTLIQFQHPDFDVIPVLKGNAYGHGLAQVAEILNEAAIRMIAVDGYFEAAQIRDITKHKILVLGYILPENVRLLDTKRCSFVAQDIKDLKALASTGKKVDVHLELNTGFNRLGINPEQLNGYLNALKKYPNLTLEGVMTHLVDADNESDDSFDQAQQEVFDEQLKRILDKGFEPKYIHIAQTAGSTKIESKYANTLRLGIGTYGINILSKNDPKYKRLNDLKPALELKSTIIKVNDLKKGETVSYNATFKASKPMRIGTLPLGYYEGVSRELSNRGFVTYKDKELPIVGRVCMNHTMIDLKDTGLKVGDSVTVISSDPKKSNSVVGMWNKLGLFPYSTLTNISSSVRKTIV